MNLPIYHSAISLFISSNSEPVLKFILSDINIASLAFFLKLEFAVFFNPFTFDWSWSLYLKWAS